MSLTITVPAKDFWDEQKERFINVKETTLVLEHSLLSVSKWEAKYKKPFLVERALDTPDKVLYYLECMTITPQKPDPKVYLGIDTKMLNKIMEYINDPMTATWFREDKNPKKGKKIQKEIMTSEVIYWEMIALEIPIEFQKWHLNRLMTLIRVCNAKNNPEKMSKKDMLAQNAALNKARRAKIHSKG